MEIIPIIIAVLIGLPIVALFIMGVCLVCTLAILIPILILLSPIVVLIVVLLKKRARKKEQERKELLDALKGNQSADTIEALS